MELIYLVADALDTTLHELQDGLVRGHKTKTIKLGPWQVRAEVVVCSDQLKPTESSFVVRIKGDVWVYLVVTPALMRAFVFSGLPWGLKSKDVSKFGLGEIKSTMKQIKPHVKAVFLFDTGRKEWRQGESGIVDEVIAA